MDLLRRRIDIASELIDETIYSCRTCPLYLRSFWERVIIWTTVASKVPPKKYSVIRWMCDNSIPSKMEPSTAIRLIMRAHGLNRLANLKPKNVPMDTFPFVLSEQLTVEQVEWIEKVYLENTKTKIDLVYTVSDSGYIETIKESI